MPPPSTYRQHPARLQTGASSSGWAVFTIGILWLLAVALSFGWSKDHNRIEYENLAIEHARSHLQKDILIRRWTAMHGGVYVPVSDTTPPNPHLAHIDRRDVKTTDGQSLTLVNPAYLTRQLYELAQTEAGVQGHITSLQPLRPANAADAWEAAALLSFEKGNKETNELVTINGRPYLRHMQPLITESACLKCHAHQGYKVGDVRGGISVSIPFDSYEARLAEETSRDILAHTATALIGLLGILFAGFRITRTEKALRRAIRDNELLAERDILLSKLNDGVLGLNREGRITFANPAALTTLGYRESDLLDKHAHDTLHHHRPDGSPFPREECPSFKALTTGIPYTIEDHLIHADGHFVPVHLTSCPVIEHGVVVGEVVAFHDISARLQAESVIRETARRLSEAQQLAKIGNWELDLKTDLLSWSDEVFRIFEIDPTRFEATYEAFVAAIHPDDRAMVNEAYKSSLLSRRPYATKHRLPMPDGRIKWVHEQCATEFDPDGKPLRSIGTVQDITDLKQAEEDVLTAKREVDLLNASLERRVNEAVAELETTHQSLMLAHEQLTQAETMASLGRMVALIAHELNTPIGNSRLAATVIRERAHNFSEDMRHGLRRSDLDKFMRTVIDGTDLLETGLNRAAHLIQSFKQIAINQESSQRRQFGLESVVQEVEAAIGQRVRDAGHQLRWIGTAGITMDSFPSLISQTLVELIENALHHAFTSLAHGQIEITVRRLSRPESADDNQIEFRISDNGVGIPAADRKRVFEPFFTTRMGKRTGLGLSIIYNAVTLLLGGKISVASEHSPGTQFVINLPQVASPDPSAKDPTLS